MVGMPVYIRIKATLTGNYSMSIVITIDEQDIELYVGELYLMAGIEIAVDVADFLITNITERTKLTVEVKHIDEDIQEYGISEDLFVYPGACESDEVAQSKITFSKTTPQNWLLTTRTINNEIFIPETELTDDVFLKRHVINTFEPGEFILIKDHSGNTLLSIMDNTPLSITQLRRDLFVSTQVLHNVFHFCYEYYNSISHKITRKCDFSVYITQAPITDEFYFIDFINQFGIKERIQILSLIHTPSYGERTEYMRYNESKAKLLPKYERLQRTDSLTGTFGLCYAERLSFVMDMIQATEQVLVTPTGEYPVKITPDNNTVGDSKRKEYPLSVKIDFSEKSEFASFYKNNYNTRIFTAPFGPQFK